MGARDPAALQPTLLKKIRFVDFLSIKRPVLAVSKMQLLSRFDQEMRGDQLSEDCSATAVRRSNKLQRSHYTKIGSGELFRTFVVVCYLRRVLVAAAIMLQILRLRLFARRICVCSAVATSAGKKIYNHRV